MTGVLNLVSAPGQAGAPAAAAASIAASPQAPDNATLAASQQGAWLRGTNSSLNASQAQVQILCRPMPARRADAGQSNAVPQQCGKCRGCHYEMSSFSLLLFVFTCGLNWGLVIIRLALMWELRSRGSRGVVGGVSADGGGGDGGK